MGRILWINDCDMYRRCKCEFMSINTNDNMNIDIHWCTWKVLLEIVDHNNGENAWEKYDNGFIMHECLFQAKLSKQSSTWKVLLKD